jgi:hypothetical protein
MSKLDPQDQIDMGDGRLRPRIVIITSSSEIGFRLKKTREEAEAMAQAAFNKLKTDYPTEKEILAECGIVIDPREDKPWPKEEDCQGCDKRKEGPHRFGCSIHGARQVKLPMREGPDGKLVIDLDP